MAKMPRPETLEERTAAATLVAEVTGDMKIRDYITRESVGKGGTVRLNPAKTLVDALVEAGNIKVLPAGNIKVLPAGKATSAKG